MLKNFLSVFICLPVLMLWSCSKSTDNVSTGRGTFVLYDVRDIAADKTLYIKVAQDTGDAPTVKLTVTGLPPNITAVISPDNGVPDFSSSILFRQTEAVPPGNYPIVITGTSSSFTRSYPISLVVNDYNGWALDYNTFYNDSNTRHTSDIIESFSTDNGKATFMASIQGAWPVKDGVYTYNIGNASGAVQLQFIDEKTGTYYRSTATTDHATLKILDGKFTFSAYSIPISSGSNTKTLSVMVNE